MKNFVNEFKTFAIKGNMIDLAVGVIIGTAFGKVVSSLVSDIIMPPLGWLTGGIDFSKKVLSLPQVFGVGSPVTLNYGLFLNSLINFVIVAFAIFLVIKQINRFKKVEEAKPTSTPEDIVLLREIRDSLKK